MSAHAAFSTELLDEAEAQPVAAPVAAEWRPVTAIKQDVAAPARLKRLTAELATLRMEASAPLLRKAVKALNARRFTEAVEHAARAVDVDDQNGHAWYVLAICKEKTVDYTTALLSYERAISLMPDHDHVALDLGRLASAMKFPEMAEKFLAYHLLRHPNSMEAVNDLACAYRDQSRFTDALELVRTYLLDSPEVAVLWNTLGSILYDQGDATQSIVFYDEAIRLQPDFDAAFYNRGNAKIALGDSDGALEDCAMALRSGGANPTQAAMMRFARSNLLLIAGRIGEGWDAYAARKEEAYTDFLHHLVEDRPWQPETDLSGRRLLVMAEQGLGDEIMFGNVLPDVIDALGPDGRLLLGVEPRLVPLFQRSFPTATVVEHKTRKINHMVIRATPEIASGDYDLWSRMGDLLRRFRRDLDSFPRYPEGYLKADPARVEHWRATLAAMGPEPKVGVIWKSMLMSANRVKFYSPFELWSPVLKTPGVTFINLQIGDCADDLKRAQDQFGVEILQPPGIDLRVDLDDLGALCRALDLVIGPATATTNIAAAVGTPTWFVSTPDAWPRLGSDHYPWYSQARTFAATLSYDWAAVMRQVAEALAETYPAPN